MPNTPAAPEATLTPVLTPTVPPATETPVPLVVLDVPAILMLSPIEAVSRVAEQFGEPRSTKEQEDSAEYGWLFEREKILFSILYFQEADGTFSEYLIIITGALEDGHTNETLLVNFNLDVTSPNYHLQINPSGLETLAILWVTLAPAEAQGPDPADAAYMLELQVRLLEFQKYFSQFQEYSEQVANDNTLLLDSSWKTKMGITLGMLQVSANAVAEIQPTERYQTSHAELVKLAEETDLMTSAYAKGVDNFDSASIEKAVQHMTNMGVIVARANELMREANAAP